MNWIKYLIVFYLLSLSVNSIAQSTTRVDHIKLAGHVGSRMDACIEHRVKAQDVDHLIEPFRHKTEDRRWQSEFWGKWVQGAIASYQYNQDPQLYAIIKKSVDELISTQLPNGYIGNYAPESQLQQWDVWGRKYSSLGLIAWYRISGEKPALEAACRIIDHLMTQVGPGLTSIVATGNYVGMPSSSVLEPVMYLYNLTRESRYLEFAKYIVAQWETPEGPQLISKALADVPVAGRFPHPETWFSRENGQKAYEMMSCYEGLLELYKVTHNPVYLSVVEKTVAHIINEEINVAGSGSAFECWYGGKARQHIPCYHMMETCVTFTWMQLCKRLLEMTGNPLYADQIESSIYNALLASLKADASQIAKYSPLEGFRHEGEEQCGMHINCCNANGPRAFALIPQFAVQTVNDEIRVNYYGPTEAVVQLPRKNLLTLHQKTDYPVSDIIELTVRVKKSAQFPLSLRIPVWSKENSLTVNGEPQPSILAGSYITLDRLWNDGDKVILTLDLRGRLVEQNGAQAILRGPVVLARDSRFQDGFVDATSVIQNKDGYVMLTPTSSPSFAWMSFTAPLVIGTDLERNGKPQSIHFCDFASAGNTWDKNERYRVWLPKTLNVIHSPYKPYNE